MNLLRKVLLGLVVAAGAAAPLTVGAQHARADFGDRFAYGHAFPTRAGAEWVRVNRVPSVAGMPTFVKYCNVGPNGAGWYVCY
jgi:hypothetical protein